MNRREFMLAAAGGALAANVCTAETVTAEQPDAFLEYVEATGTQYIDTGVNAETGLKARIDFEFSSSGLSSADWSLLDAATVDNVSDNRTRIFLCHTLNSKPFFGYGLKERGAPANSFNFVGNRRCEIVTDVSDGTQTKELILSNHSRVMYDHSLIPQDQIRDE